MNKTIVASVCAVTLGLTAVAGMYLYYTYASKTLYKTRDRLTVCMQMVMSESRESGKPVEIDKAKEICG